MTSIIVPYSEIRVYRPEVDYRELISGNSTLLLNKRNRKNIKPSPINFKEVYTVSTDEFKGLEHEETALFGHVAEFNIGSTPVSRLFRRILPNDHIEIFYENMGYHQKDNDINRADTSLFDSRDLFTSQGNTEQSTRPDSFLPKFQGSVWKANLIQKPSQVTTKVGAWGYLRMLQYVNVPKSFEGRESEIRTMALKDSNTFKMSKTDRITFRNDFLDYVDNIFKEYLKNLGTPSMFSRTILGKDEQERPLITFDSNIDAKQGKFYVLGSDTTISDAMENNFKDYLNKLSNTGFNDWSIEAMNDQEELIEKIIPPESPVGLRNNLKSGIFSMTRFMDLTAELKMQGRPAEGDDPAVDDSILETFRVTGDVIVMDQFFLTNILTAGITMDHGINAWYTPIVTYSDQFESRMKQINQNLLSHLVYVKIKIGRENGALEDGASIPEHRMEDFVTFNLDTFSIFQYLEEMVGAAIVQQKKIDDLYEFDSDLSLMRTTRNMNSIDVLSLILTNVVEKLPQTVNPINEVVTIDIKENLKGIVTGGKNKDGEEEKENFISEKKRRRRIISDNVTFIHKFLLMDDNMIEYIKNIPASYIRQDVYQGSQFKVATTDSLSLPRIIQLIATSMKGYPATNSPETAETKGNVNNYSIFLANRVILKPRVYYSFENSETDTKIEYTCERSLRGKVEDRSEKVFMFLHLEVSYKTQVSKAEEIEYEIDIGEINDFEMIKGATQNHFFNFSLDKTTVERIQKMGKDTENISEEEDVNWDAITAPEVHMYFGSDSTVGVSPSEFQTLTTKDMTQDLNYDPIRRREVINGHIADPSATNTDLPIYDVFIQGKEIIDADPNLDVDTRLQGAFVRPSSIGANGRKISYLWEGQDTSGTAEVDYTKIDEYARIGNLLSVQTYVDFTDILDEIKYLKILSDDSDLQYRHIANSDKPLFEDVFVSLPFSFNVTTQAIKTVRVSDTSKSGSLKEIIDYLHETFFGVSGRAQFKKEHMAWSFPVKGQVLEIETDENGDAINRDNNFPSIHNIDLLRDDSNKHNLLKSNLISIYMLDLFIKGVRYLLWSIAKSRFTAHVYTPIEHIKQSIDSERITSEFGENSSPIQSGSSIRFFINEGNTLLLGDKGSKHPVELYGNDILSENRQSGDDFDSHPMVFVKRDIRSGDGEDSGSAVTEKSFVWYVSKKIVYIGESGMMMRLLMTEGSFDWTLFFREDTVATRISENYLLSGMGNFFVRGDNNGV